MKHLIIASMFALVGCASSSYQEQVATSKLHVYVDSVSITKDKPAFVLMSGMKDIPTDDLRFQQYSEIATKALKEAGFVQANGKGSSHIIIKLSYSISDAKVYTEVDSSVNNKYRNGAMIREVETESYSYEKYVRRVSLKAYDKRNKQVWATDMESEGESNNLREMFPYMMAAGIQHFGENTNAKAFVQVMYNESSLEYLRKPASN